MGTVELVIGSRTMWRLLFLIVSTFTLLSILIFFYKSDVHDFDPSYGHLAAQGQINTKNSQEQTLMNCEALTTLEECEKHAPVCVAVKGLECSVTSTQRETVFGYCISSKMASTVTSKKKKVSPSIPTWMSSHPDHEQDDTFCARPQNSFSSLARFKQFVPPEWVQEPCSGCCVPPAPIDPSEDTSLGLVVSVYNEYLSLHQSLKSWKEHGLLDYVQERIIYIDGGNKEIRDKIESLGNSFGFTVYNNEENVGLGKALANAINLAKSRFLLFLEKDWKLIEPQNIMKGQLDLAKQLMLTKENGSRADVIKFRSRWNAGSPNIHPAKTHPPKWDEDQGVNMWLTSHEWEPHLYCNIYHFEKDDYLLRNHPNRMWKCGCNHGFWCFDAGQCGWTNNPIMFGREWWINTFTRISQLEHNRIFELGTYYSNEWLLPHWVVAEGDGLFTHSEVGEHEQFDFF